MARSDDRRARLEPGAARHHLGDKYGFRHLPGVQAQEGAADAGHRGSRCGTRPAELTRYTEQRLREADARMAAMQEEHRDCEQLLLTAQSEVEHLKRQLVARVRHDE